MVLTLQYAYVDHTSGMNTCNYRCASVPIVIDGTKSKGETSQAVVTHQTKQMQLQRDAKHNEGNYFQTLIRLFSFHGIVASDQFQLFVYTMILMLLSFLLNL